MVKKVLSLLPGNKHPQSSLQPIFVLCVRSPTTTITAATTTTTTTTNNIVVSEPEHSKLHVKIPKHERLLYKLDTGMALLPHSASS